MTRQGMEERELDLFREGLSCLFCHLGPFWVRACSEELPKADEVWMQRRQRGGEEGLQKKRTSQHAESNDEPHHYE